MISLLSPTTMRYCFHPCLLVGWIFIRITYTLLERFLKNLVREWEIFIQGGWWGFGQDALGTVSSNTF